MREIKFRGKFKNGNWEYGGLRYGDMGQAYILPHGANSIVELVDRHTVGQYMGLKDKNGQEIYEGDIVKFINHNNGKELLREVNWNEKDACFQFGDSDGWKFQNYLEMTKSTMEIIGNTYENSELLGVK